MIRKIVARQWIWLAIALVIAVAALSTIGDVRHLGERLDQFEWRALGVAIALATANYALRFVRWQLYLTRQSVSVPLASSVVVFGAGLSLSITPAKLGELVKSYLLREMHGVAAARTAPIVVAERVSDLVALLVLAVIGVAVYGVDARFVIAAGVLVGIGLVLLAWQRPTRALIDLVTRPRRFARLRTPLHETLGHLATLCRPWPLLVSTLIAVPAWGCECIGFWVICNAFPATDVRLGFAAAIYAGTTIAGALSFLPGGLGVTEGAMTLALVDGSQVDRATAVAATLLARLATLWFAVALGVVFLAIARARIRSRNRSGTTERIA